VNLPIVLDRIWRQEASPAFDASSVLSELDEGAKLILTHLQDYLQGTLSLGDLDIAFSNLDLSLQSIPPPIQISQTTRCLLVGLQILRDHSDAALYKPIEERQLWYAQSAKAAGMSETEFLMLRQAIFSLERHGLLRHDNRH
jgi:hypothetical protein